MASGGDGASAAGSTRARAGVAESAVQTAIVGSSPRVSRLPVSCRCTLPQCELAGPRDRLEHGPARGFGVEPTGRVTSHLRDEHHTRLVTLVGQRNRAAPGHTGVRGLGGLLDVLGIHVLAADDDEILQPPDDDDLAAVRPCAQIARAQIGPPSGIRERRLECVVRLLRAFPVARRDRRALHPDFANGPVPDRASAIGVDDDDVGFRLGPAAPDEADAARAWRRSFEAAIRQGRRVNLEHARAVSGGRGRDLQRRLGQAVSRLEARATEPAGLERLGKPIERLGANRLRTAVRRRPGRQVQSTACLVIDTLAAELVGKIRPTADGGAAT